MKHIAVVEDDSSASQQIQNYLSLYQKENEQEFSVTVFADGLSILEDYHPIWDIILMDIEMSLMDGMTAAKCIRELDQSVIIIFITNMAKYAIKGYEVGALDFVLKPVSYFAFSLKITKALTSLAHREKASVLLTFKNGMMRLPAEDITYIEILRRQMIVHTETEVYPVAGTLTEMEAKLGDAGFARCNKGYLVNLRHVKRITADSVQVGNDELLISRRRREDFLAAMTDYYGENGK